jgi:hypothetical protein
MQVRSLSAIAAVAAALFAGAVQAQEIDRSETLQARNLASQAGDVQQRSRVSVVAETRNLQAEGALKAVGEKADAPVVPAVPTVARGLTRAEVKADLAQWRSAHPLVVGERG